MEADLVKEIVHDTDWICVSNQENYIEPTATTAITHMHLTENVHSVKRRSLRKVGAQANKCILVDHASEDADVEQVVSLAKSRLQLLAKVGVVQKRQSNSAAVVP